MQYIYKFLHYIYILQIASVHSKAIKIKEVPCKIAESLFVYGLFSSLSNKKHLDSARCFAWAHNTKMQLNKSRLRRVYH